ncbi:hypothetical protein LOD99_6969 [Oopsacas minuta]|uniref:SEFIR domain-containing protein n=1 Tax=Oopsacas minuta TaxID=111878 RepID=A0AAV7JKC4_9METZ|nr:hypothetical protein LOD99_6969 [Oopsacas minuta]
MAASSNTSVKNVFICHPDDPDPLNAANEYAPYKKRIFCETVTQFVEVLKTQPNINVVCRTDISSEEFDGIEAGERIKTSDCIIVICCPSLVYLTSESAQSAHKYGENQTVLELKAILGQFLINNCNRIIPVFLNSSSDSIADNLPAELIANTTSVRVCITTLPDGEEEFWPAQQNSINNLVRIIHMKAFSEISQSPVSGMDAVDQNWRFHFIDQYAIDFIACVFEERNIYTDTEIMKKYLEIDSEQNIEFRALLRIWLRELRHRKVKVQSVFNELGRVLAQVGREDLMYQVKFQFELYTTEVYEGQSLHRSSLQLNKVSHPQAKF